MELSGKLLIGIHSAGTQHLILPFYLLPTWNMVRKVDREGMCRGRIKPQRGSHMKDSWAKMLGF